ncbi:hypothetical protein JCM11641_004304 [Rhodosporidiobolus odoratus]
MSGLRAVPKQLFVSGGRMNDLLIRISLDSLRMHRATRSTQAVLSSIRSPISPSAGLTRRPFSSSSTRFSWFTSSATTASSDTLVDTAATLGSNSVPSVSPDLLPLLFGIVLANSVSSPRDDDEDSSAPQQDTSQPPPWYIKSSPNGEGLGAFASRDLSIGQLLIAERPLCIWPNGLSAPQAQDLFNQMSDKQKKVFMELTDGGAETRKEYSELDEVRVRRACNGFSLPILGVEEMEGRTAGFVFPRIARVNHSCAPNAAQVMNWSTLRLELYSITPTARDTELTIEYLPSLLLLTHSERQTALKTSFGFSRCLCPVCTAPPAEIERSDERRREIKRLVGGLREGARDRKETMRKMERVRVLCEEEGVRGLPDFGDENLNSSFAVYKSLYARAQREAGAISVEAGAVVMADDEQATDQVGTDPPAGSSARASSDTDQPERGLSKLPAVIIKQKTSDSSDSDSAQLPPLPLAHLAPLSPFTSPSSSQVTLPHLSTILEADTIPSLPPASSSSAADEVDLNSTVPPVGVLPSGVAVSASPQNPTLRQLALYQALAARQQQFPPPPSTLFPTFPSFPPSLPPTSSHHPSLSFPYFALPHAPPPTPALPTLAGASTSTSSSTANSPQHLADDEMPPSSHSLHTNLDGLNLVSPGISTSTSNAGHWPLLNGVSADELLAAQASLDLWSSAAFAATPPSSLSASGSTSAGLVATTLPPISHLGAGGGGIFVPPLPPAPPSQPPSNLNWSTLYPHEALSPPVLSGVPDALSSPPSSLGLTTSHPHIGNNHPFLHPSSRSHHLESSSASTSASTSPHPVPLPHAHNEIPPFPPSLAASFAPPRNPVSSTQTQGSQFPSSSSSSPSFLFGHHQLPPPPGPLPSPSVSVYGDPGSPAPSPPSSLSLSWSQPPTSSSSLAASSRRSSRHNAGARARAMSALEMEDSAEGEGSEPSPAGVEEGGGFGGGGKRMKESSSVTADEVEEDKRRRNTEASARFRAKKKQRDAELQQSTAQLRERVANLEKEKESLSNENRWLRDIVAEKAEAQPRLLDVLRRPSVSER